jgi:hypothetical protein
MAIPNKPLVISDYDIEELTLAEHRCLYGDTYIIDEFRQFLEDHIDHAQSWTVAEIRKIKRKELAEVRAQIYAKLEEMAVPLANAPS